MKVAQQQCLGPTIRSAESNSYSFSRESVADTNARKSESPIMLASTQLTASQLTASNTQIAVASVNPVKSIIAVWRDVLKPLCLNDSMLAGGKPI